MKNLKLLAALCTFLVFFSAHAEPSLSGYFNFEHFDSDSSQTPYYDMHHMNLMLSHETNSFKLFAEIEYEHSPATEDGQGNITTERAWAQWGQSQYFNIRMGKMLDGSLYQENHYPSVTVNMTPPLITHDGAIFDTQTEGIRLFGELGAGFDYTLDDGQKPSHEVEGNPEQKHQTYAVGYGFETGNLKAHMQLRHARYHTKNAVSREDVQATGYDLNLTWKNLTLWFETAAAKNKAKSTDHSGSYAILSYGFDIGDNMIIPFYMMDNYKNKATGSDAMNRTGLGVAYRPEPSITVKLEFLFTPSYNDGTNTSTAKHDTEKQWGVGFVYFYN